MDGTFWDGGTQAECVAALVAEFGPPQPSVDLVDPQIAALAEHTVPDVWYLEQLSPGPT